MYLIWSHLAAKIGSIAKVLIPLNLILPILQGPLKGKKWFVSSGVLEYYLGSYELNKVKLFQKHIQEGMVIYDIGAHVGYFSLLAATLVKDGCVISFEPNRRNIDYLRQHIIINNYSNIFLKMIAISDKNNLALFKEGNENSTGKISKYGNLFVVTRTIDSMVESGEIPSPNFMKIDVEGHEIYVLKGSSKTLRMHKPMISIDTHNDEIKKNCITFLRSHGYSIRPETENNIDDAKLFAYYSG